MLWIDWTRISWQRKDEFEAKPKELEGMVSTIMMKGTAVADPHGLKDSDNHGDSTGPVLGQGR